VQSRSPRDNHVRRIDTTTETQRPDSVSCALPSARCSPWRSRAWWRSPPPSRHRSRTRCSSSGTRRRRVPRRHVGHGQIAEPTRPGACPIHHVNPSPRGRTGRALPPIVPHECGDDEGKYTRRTVAESRA
jgi:hypothetical protein